MLEIVIPVYGRPDLLEQCLIALGQYTKSAMLIDDHGPDTADIRKLAADFGAKYFRNSENFGFPRTVNRGMNKVKERFALILNTDVILDSDAIDVLLSEMSDPQVGIASPLLLFPAESEWGNPGMIQHAGMAHNILGRPFHLFLGWKPDNPRAIRRRDDLNAVTGACMLVSMKAWKKAGGFAEAYGRGTYEDMELCLRMRDAGYKIVMNPAARGTHTVGASAKLNGGYPLNQNLMIYQQRVGALIKHDEYKFW